MKRQHIIETKLENLKKWASSGVSLSQIQFFRFLVRKFYRFIITLGYSILSVLSFLRKFFRGLVSFVVAGFSKLRAFLVKPFLYFLGGTVFGVVFVLMPLEFYRFYQELPDPDLLVEKGTRGTTRILDRNGILLYEIFEDRKYAPVDLDQIPDHVIKATLAIEDSEFYNHSGFRPLSILRAARAYIVDNRVEGASTITQQLVKNVLLSPERTFDRKVRELILSLLVERRYTKEEILELYLNNISYGGSAWGIEAASQKFFGKSVWELNLAEASMLAGLPSAPSIYSPLNGGADLARARQKQVLQRMTSLGHISQAEAAEALETDLIYARQEDFIRAPHFVFYVRSLLEREFGKRMVIEGGLTVTTTLDVALQDRVQDLVRQGVQQNAYLGLSNGAAVVLDSRTGGILAYVGSVDFFREGWGAFDVVQAQRQPGSAIKPVTYALAFMQGFTPASVVEDRPVSYPQPGQLPYRPVNYDGRFRGPVNLRQALANSYNIPAVKLVESLGSENMVYLGSLMGLNSWKDSDSNYGLAVTLGGKEVTLLELSNVFGTLSRQGNYTDVAPLVSVRDARGRVLYTADDPQGREVLDPEAAFLVTDILADNYARAEAFGLRSPLYIPGRNVAVKTGTTDNKRDNWTLGYTPSYVVGVWVGNNDNTPMNRYLASGLTGAAPIWNSVMTVVLEDTPVENFEIPENVFLKVDESCGRREYFVRGSNVPESLCPKKSDKDSEDSE